MTSQKFLTDELSHRLAAIDIGTNSIRLVVAEALREGNYRILDEERVSTRLGRRLHDSGKLDKEAVDQSLDALRRFKQIAEGFQVQELRTIATCAVREAKNGTDFCDLVQKEIGLEIEVISAQKEAHLAFYSVRRSFDLTDKNIVMADIGGGSTEIVLASGNLVEAIYTTQLGAVRLTEMFGGGQAMAGDDYGKLTKYIDRRLRKQTKKLVFAPHLLIGSGGTFTSLASMMMASKSQEGLPMRGYQVSRAEVRHLVDRLRKMTPKERRGVAGLNPDRADIIVSGLAVIDRIMKRFKINTLQAHSRGVRDGLLLAMIERSQGGSRTPEIDPQASVEQLARACGTEMEHGRHVALLAGKIYQQLVEPMKLDPGDQSLLEAAAQLQDVGYLIDYDRHHKHSYHLILNSRLPGFQPRQLELIANVARYHRGADPKKKHANYLQLSVEDRQLVLRLAAVLRLAGGLDRSHSQQVTDVKIEMSDGETELLVCSEEHPDVDLWGARQRAGLFEKAFKTSLTIDWQGATVGAEAS